MDFHEYCTIFPYDESLLPDLEKSITINGQLEPIWTYEGKILDGRHRFKACEAAGIAPEFSPIPSGIDPLDFVIQKNLHRRQLDTTQRSVVAARISNLRPGHQKSNAQNCAFEGPPKNTGKSEDSSANLSQGDAAKAMNVSRRSVQAAKKVIENAAPEIVEAAEKGEVKISDAAKIADKPKEEQKEALSKVKAGKAKTLTEAVEESQPERETDKNGEPWSDLALEMMGSVAKLQGIVRDCQAMIRTLNTMRDLDDKTGKADPVATRFDLAGWVSALKKVPDNFLCCKPHCNCPYCDGEGKKEKKRCEPCKGQGWVPKSIWIDSPKAHGMKANSDA